MLYLKEFYFEKMTWIRTLTPPDKEKREKKLDDTGIELGTFGFESQNATPKPPGLSYKEPSNCTYNNYSTKSEEQFG